MKRLSQTDQGTTKIINVTDPTAAQDAATKNYIDSTRTFIFDHVESGCVWTGDAYGSTRAASMSSGVVWIGGKKLTVAAVSARTFTASKDTYVGLIDAGNGTATVIYYDNTINTTSPTLATGGYTVLIAIIVTAAGNIASVASINQGQHNKVVPIISSVAMTTTDALGNLIYPRDPNRRTLSYRQIFTNTSVASTSVTQITGMICPVIVPANRRVRVTLTSFAIANNALGFTAVTHILNGAIGVGADIAAQQFHAAANGFSTPATTVGVENPASTTMTYYGALNAPLGNTATISFSGTCPISMTVELI